MPIVVKRGEKIVTRSILHLLWDEKNQRPVLFQERHYSNVQDKAIADAMNQRAIQKAQALGIPLLSKEVGEGAPYRGTVSFLGGGTAPFTYSDASATRTENGVQSGAFTIKGSHILYTPPRRG